MKFKDLFNKRKENTRFKDLNEEDKERVLDEALSEIQNKSSDELTAEELEHVGANMNYNEDSKRNQEKTFRR